MKIATNTSISPIGGIARRVKEMKRKAADSGGSHTLVIIEIHPQERSVTEGKHTKLYRIPFPESVKPHTIYRELSSLIGLEQRFEPTIREIQKILCNEQVDVVLSEGAYYAPWCLTKATKQSGIPLVILYAGVLKYETRHFPEPLKTLMIELENDFIDPRLSYLFPSHLTKSAIETEYRKVPRAKIIPNGISEEFFQSEPISNSGGIGFVGRATQIKNPAYLLRLKKELKKQKMDGTIHMVSNFSKKNRLRKTLKKAGIKIQPVMDTSNLRDFYRSMGIIISPSFFETYGNVPLESVAAGTPALINKNMGVAEIFKKHNLQDYILDFEDVSHVAHKIESLRHLNVNPNIRESLRQYLWNSVIEEYYSWCKREISLSTYPLLPK